MHLAAVT